MAECPVCGEKVIDVLDHVWKRHLVWREYSSICKMAQCTCGDYAFDDLRWIWMRDHKLCWTREAYLSRLMGVE